MRYLFVIAAIIFVGRASLADSPGDAITSTMRTVQLAKNASAVEFTVAPDGTNARAWQRVAPKSFKQSLRPQLSVELAWHPRFAVADRGLPLNAYAGREQLTLGLNADPLAPAYSELPVAARVAIESRYPLDYLLLPPLQTSFDEFPKLIGDIPSLAAKPYTQTMATAQRGSAPPRSEVGIPDPFLVQNEVRLKEAMLAVDPPPANFSTPERPEFTLQPVAK